jgi:hypothetical protein
MNTRDLTSLVAASLTGHIRRIAGILILAGPLPVLTAQTLYSPGGTVWSSSNGNVGIGTSSPSQKLDVNGNINVEGNGFYVPGNHDFDFYDSSNEIPVMALHGTTGYAPRFDMHAAGDATTNVSINASGSTYFNGGNVGIGTTNPTYLLSVHGTVEATEVVVQTGWSDYVFDRDYRLKPLSEVEFYIKAEHHLPGIPSEKQVAANGVSLGDMQSRLLAQIEQLTLHQIELEKRLDAQAREIARLERANAKPPPVATSP